MSGLSVSPDGVRLRPPTLARLVSLLAAASALSRRVGGLAAGAIRIGATLVRTAAARLGKAICSIRLPVRHATHARVARQLDRFEVQVIASVRVIECREKRTRALLALARTAYEIGRDNRPFLAAVLDELRVEQYWMRKQHRIFSAAQISCSVAGLAARSGHAGIGHDAYLCGQQYNGKVEGVDRKIGLSVVFADVAALLAAGYDQVAWLATAMELACGIPEDADRIGAVSFVARKMVIDRIPPCDNRLVDRRFAVDVAAMAEKPPSDEAAPSVESRVGDFDLGFGAR